MERKRGGESQRVGALVPDSVVPAFAIGVLQWDLRQDVGQQESLETTANVRSANSVHSEISSLSIIGVKAFQVSEKHQEEMDAHPESQRRLRAASGGPQCRHSQYRLRESSGCRCR